MEAVEKEGMKLYTSLGKISGAESVRLSGLLEDALWQAWETKLDQIN